MILLKPWRWNRWGMAAVIPIVMAIYFFSAAPLLHVLVFSGGLGMPLPATTDDVVITFYQPIWLLAENSAAANAVLEWQHHRLFLLFDPNLGTFKPGTIQQMTRHGRTNFIEYPGSRAYRSRKAMSKGKALLVLPSSE